MSLQVDSRRTGTEASQPSAPPPRPSGSGSVSALSQSLGPKLADVHASFLANLPPLAPSRVARSQSAVSPASSGAPSPNHRPAAKQPPASPSRSRDTSAETARVIAGIKWDHLYSSPLFENMENFQKVAALHENSQNDLSGKIVERFDAARLLLDSLSVHTIGAAIRACLNDGTLTRLNITIDILGGIIKSLEERFGLERQEDKTT